MKNYSKILKSLFVVSIAAVIGIIIYTDHDVNEVTIKKDIKSTKKALIVNGAKYDGPEKFAYYQSAIRAGQEDLNAPLLYPQYTAFSKNRELAKAKQLRSKSRTSATTATFIERGPANVPGRTRTIITDPDDASNATWFAGNVSGGIWKTTNSGGIWTEIAPDLNNMAIVTLAMSPVNTSVIYAGTGEGFIYSGSFILNGEGIYKTTDKGVTWSLLSSTITDDFINVSRIIVDPADENILLASTSGTKKIGGNVDTNGAIMRSTDGGSSWSKVYEATAAIQQIIVAPNDFSIQYATIAGIGVVKSIDAGLTWNNASTGLSITDRIELSVSYSNPDKVYGSALGGLSGTGSDLYLTEDGGGTWGLVNVEYEGAPFDFLGGQGWYDNTIMVNPFDDAEVYFGGVDVFSIVRNSSTDGSTSTYSVNLDDIRDLVSFVNFGADYAGGILDVGSVANEINVEVRFGAGLSQMAHRFKVPDGQGSGVPDGDYAYQDYVEVPFEVWDVTNNTQLMASFRDQQNDGVYNLIAQNTDGSASTHSREYLYINNVPYDATNADANIAISGGHVNNSMYFMWPTLAPEATWDANNLPTSTLRISFTTLNTYGADLTIVADTYGSFNQVNTDVHPDQHYLTPVITNVAAKEFKIILGNDGGMYLSDTGTSPGKTNGSWTDVGNGYNTTQFYGADKLTGVQKYLGGAQDNGTWISNNNEVASTTSQYNHIIGGDGFEVVAHYTNPDKYIGGWQYNGFRATEDGGITSYDATSGLSVDGGSFVSRLSNAYQDPDILFTVEEDGVYRSIDFGKNWKLSTMNDPGWGFWSGIDVEVSKANPRIVWAGGRMTDTGSLFVSQDGGLSFDAVPNFANIGLCTGIYSHPTDPNTAFAVFSVANSPKVLKTIDLGQTWVDLSGFSSNSTSTGFPNVATFALQAMPYNDNVLWAGTEIGLFESLDGGVTWSIMDDFPSVTIWDFKIKDGQVIIATHGRGIWTADIAELAGFTAPVATLAPRISEIGLSQTSMQMNMKINQRSLYDNAEVFANGNVVASIAGNSITGIVDVSIDFTDPGIYAMQVVAYKNNTGYYTEEISLEVIAPVTPVLEYFTDFDNNFNNNDFTLDLWSIGTPVGFSNNILSTQHPYPTGDELGVTSVDLIANFNTPIIVASENALIKFKEVVQVEEGEIGTVYGSEQFWDYVIVEGSTDGVNYIPLLDGYDSDANSKWSGSSNTASSSLLVDRSINLLDTYNADDIVRIRFRLFSDALSTAWGWGIDDLKIQIVDNDGDGYDAVDDCDDTDSSINPGAEDIPENGIDEDCSGSDKIIAAINKDVDSKIEVYPNPSSGLINIQFDHIMNGEVRMKVIDFGGKVVRMDDINNSTGSNNVKIDLSNLSFGIYLIELRNNTDVISKRVLIY